MDHCSKETYKVSSILPDAYCKNRRDHEKTTIFTRSSILSAEMKVGNHEDSHSLKGSITVTNHCRNIQITVCCK